VLGYQCALAPEELPLFFFRSPLVPALIFCSSQTVRKFRKTGDIAMTTPPTTTSTAHLEFIGMIVEIAGVAAVVGGLVLSLHHWPAAAALIGGGTAYFIGKKLRAM
jgi:hypothetical protein